MEARIFEKIHDLLKDSKKFAVATIVNSKGSSPRRAGAKMIVMKNGKTLGSIGGDKAEEKVKNEALKTLENGKTHTIEITLLEEEKGGIGMKCGGEIEIAIEVLEPPAKLIIIGSGKVAAEVAKLGNKTGFKVTVIDPFINKNDFPDPIKIIPEKVDKAIPKIDITDRTYIAIMTRHKYDIPALIQTIKTNATYIGLMGSKKRVKSTLKHLEKEKGIHKEKLSKIHAPIGLNIGAETPEELAVSIIGEIIKIEKGLNSTEGSLKIDY